MSEQANPNDNPNPSTETSSTSTTDGPQVTVSTTPPQSQQQTPPQQNSGQSPQGGSLQRLEQQLAALPEQIVNGLREAFPQNPQSSQHSKPSGTTDSQKPSSSTTVNPSRTDQQREPGGNAPTDGRSKLAKWWFG